MDNKQYKPIIGLEIHVELKTESKMFCQNSADYFGEKPNSLTCPVCLGLPGALPVPNEKAIEWTILIAKALNCRINKISRFDRKHYFYPDLPKGYQISQYKEPIAVNGFVDINARYHVSRPPHPKGTQAIDEKQISSRFRIRRVHLEEDTAKLVHYKDETLIDFNRSGVPLVEIVTEPDFDNSDDVKRFLEELQIIIRYLGVSDADMEKGSMRLEPNISVKLKTKSAKRKAEEELPKYKVEVKNINSFRFVKQAIEYEIERQIKELEAGKTPIQETRGFNADKGITYSQRIKEEAHDYRYFPEPDIPPMVFTDQYLKIIEKQLPELPHKKLERYVKQLGIKYSDAFIITRDIASSEFFEEASSKLKAQSSKLNLKTQNLKQAVANIIVNRRVSPKLPVDEFIKQTTKLLTPKQTDEKLLDEVVKKVISGNPKVVTDYKSGKQNAIMFLIGQVMREMKGKVDPRIVIQKLHKILNTKS